MLSSTLLQIFTSFALPFVIFTGPVETVVELSSPIRIVIPKIKIDALIEHVGLTANGAMDAPKYPFNAAWFALGVNPGNIGSAVINGHFGWKDGVGAVFDDLEALQIGDRIYIEYKIGTNVVFIVRNIQMYGSGEDTSTVFFSDDGKAHLNLITCGGIWDKTSESYSDRLVVFTDREN